MSAVGDLGVVAEGTVRALARRRAAVALLLALPLAFYVARHELVGQSIRFLVVGVAWAISTFAFFAATEVRATEPRLCCSGWRWPAVLAGRVLALLAVGAVLAGGFALLVWLDQPVRSPAGVALDLVVTTVVAVALGSFLGALVRGELEGALLLFIVAGLQFIADPSSLLAHLLPFWSFRELATWAVDGPDHGSLGAGLAHAAAVLVLLAGATLVLTARRLGSVRPPHRGGAAGPGRLAPEARG